jgi:uncharacterized membrane protein
VSDAENDDAPAAALFTNLVNFARSFAAITAASRVTEDSRCARMGAFASARTIHRVVFDAAAALSRLSRNATDLLRCAGGLWARAVAAIRDAAAVVFHAADRRSSRRSIADALTSQPCTALSSCTIAVPCDVATIGFRALLSGFAVAVVDATATGTSAAAPVDAPSRRRRPACAATGAASGC